MGERTPFQHVPYFFSDVFDLSYEFWGDADGAGQIVHRGDQSGQQLQRLVAARRRRCGGIRNESSDEERELAPKWIEAKQKVSRRPACRHVRSRSGGGGANLLIKGLLPAGGVRGDGRGCSQPHHRNALPPPNEIPASFCELQVSC